MHSKLYFLSEYPIPFISLYVLSSSVWPEISDILPNYHLEDQTQPFPEHGI